MKFDSKIHHRRSIRMKGYDYSQAGAYFVTMVAYQQECLFGEVVDSEMRLNGFGEIIAQSWQWLESQYPYIELGAWVVMPNHFHGILIINDYGRGDSRIAPPVKHKPLGRLIGAFKTVSTKQINLFRKTEGQMIWQRNYYEHIIRDNADMERIWEYIESKPIMWVNDNENPMHL